MCRIELPRYPSRCVMGLDGKMYVIDNDGDVRLAVDTNKEA